MKAERRLIHIELLDPPEGYQRHYYFGSVPAIYDVLPKEIIGIGKESLWSKLHDEYKNKNMIARRAILHTSTTNRGQHVKNMSYGNK